MKRQFQLFTSAFVLVLGLNTHSWAQSAAPITAATARRIDSLFATLDNTSSPGCAVGVSQNGTVVYSRGYGMSNLEYDVPITPDSIFHVASMSKQFTAFSIALLASDGKLSLDDDIRRYLPELTDYGQRVTIRHLLTHTSGLRDGWELLRLSGRLDGAPVKEDDVLRMVARQKSLDFVPGAEFLYNDAGFTLLAVIVKRVSGQSLREFAETRIFGPLGMRDSHFHDDPTMIVRRRTSAYQPRPGGGWSIVPQAVGQSLAVGPVGLYTTVRDLLKWEQNFVDARVGGRALLDEMQTSGRLNDGTTTGYGFGLGLSTYRGVRAVGHGGADPGYLANVVRFPDQHLAIATLCNLNPIPFFFRKVDEEILLGTGALAPVTPLAPAVPVGEAETAALVGTYWSPSTEQVRRFVMKDGKLIDQVRWGALVPLGGGGFRVSEGPTEVLFPSPKTGAPQELHVPPLARNYGPPAASEVFYRMTVPSYSATDLKAYAGEYRSDEVDVSYKVVALPESGLAVLRGTFDPIPLAAVTLDKFSGRGLGWTITFMRAPSGDVTGFTIAFGTPRRLSFTRVGVAPSTGK